MRSVLTLIGRLLIVAIFLGSAWQKITNMESMTQYAATAGVPNAEIAIWAALAFELVGGVLVLLGLWTWLGALLLMAFLVPVTYYVHDFWTYPADQQQNQQIHFMKNVAIFGGLCFLLAWGPGLISLDGLRHRRKRTPGAATEDSDHH